jgi:hypothetical protein
MENGTISQGEGKDPSSFLSDIIGNSVTVKLNSGVVYKGLRLALAFLLDARTNCLQESSSLSMDT